MTRQLVRRGACLGCGEDKTRDLTNVAQAALKNSKLAWLKSMLHVPSAQQRAVATSNNFSRGARSPCYVHLLRVAGLGALHLRTDFIHS
jgi:hypothetical protein